LGEKNIVVASGDDFGAQTGPFMSLTMFHKWIKTYFAERIVAGYTFSAGHNIQVDVPAKNVLTMYQAARSLGVND